MERLFRSYKDYPHPISTVIRGEFPEWLEGSLYRIGPAKWDFDKMMLNHYFDGCALLYKFNMQNGKVMVMSRFLDSDAYKKITTVKRPVYTEFGTRCFPDPCKNVFSRYFSQLVPLDLTDNNVGNIYYIQDELYCASETNYLWKIDQKNLKAKEKVDLKNLISVNLASAHPHQCPDGTVYNLGASFMTGLKHHIFKIPSLSQKEEVHTVHKGFERASILCTINSAQKTYFNYCHSFGISEHFLLFLEQPMAINIMKMAASGVKGYCIKDCFEWNPIKKIRFHLIELNSGRELKAKFQADALFFFHHVNMYEEDGHVIADIMSFEDAKILDTYYMKNLRLGEFTADCQAQLTRFILPLNIDGKVEENLVKLSYTTATAVKQDNGVIFLKPEHIGERGFELPTINYKMFNTRKYKYVYGSGVFDLGNYSNSVIKLDLTNGKHIVWKEMNTMFPGEAVFVPRPGSVEEDDGILLVVVVDVNTDASDFLLLLDAKTMNELGRAVVPNDIELAPTIHGCFIKGQNN